MSAPTSRDTSLFATPGDFPVSGLLTAAFGGLARNWFQIQPGRMMQELSTVQEVSEFKVRARACSDHFERQATRAFGHMDFFATLTLAPALAAGAGLFNPLVLAAVAGGLVAMALRSYVRGCGATFNAALADSFLCAANGQNTLQTLMKRPDQAATHIKTVARTFRFRTNNFSL